MKSCCGNDRLSKHTVSLSTGHGPEVFWVFVTVKAGFFPPPTVVIYSHYIVGDVFTTLEGKLRSRK